ncbi:sugar dehydrogenase complex small subunit [Oceaniglobus ichthyenteri]|uniref:sugar dehydrogenase complex small subunit n=1 Tax=Oceaniglobus ichthyenteri TaxID=2136177 RepID=UPI0013DE0712|nr:sugar dehydrogenase complex small subunit [Oceaniglobus ichthyenteri]
MAHTNSGNSATITRRGLLSAVSGISVLSLTHLPGRAFAAGMDTEAFLALSENLLNKESLYEDVGAKILKSFVAMGKEDEISALADGQSDEDLANDIVAAWYTGISPDPDDLQVVTYTDALIWQAMSYSKPMAFCGGGVGYWSEPPAA